MRQYLRQGSRPIFDERGTVESNVSISRLTVTTTTKRSLDVEVILQFQNLSWRSCSLCHSDARASCRLPLDAKICTTKRSSQSEIHPPSPSQTRLVIQSLACPFHHLKKHTHSRKQETIVFQSSLPGSYLPRIL